MTIASTETSACDVADPLSIEILESHQARIGLGFLFRMPPLERMYRLQPLRHPEQPRFWCMVVYPCGRDGTPDPTGWVWVAPERLRRDELPATIAGIRADPKQWLAQATRRALRQRLRADLQHSGEATQ